MSMPDLVLRGRRVLTAEPSLMSAEPSLMSAEPSLMSRNRHTFARAATVPPSGEATVRTRQLVA